MTKVKALKQASSEIGPVIFYLEHHSYGFKVKGQIIHSHLLNYREMTKVRKRGIIARVAALIRTN